MLVVTTERTLLPGGELQQPQHCLGCCLCIYCNHLSNSPLLTTNKAEDPYCLPDHIIWSTHSLLIPTDFLPILVGTMISSSVFQKTCHSRQPSRIDETDLRIQPPGKLSGSCHSLMDAGRLDHRQRTSLLRAQQAE